MAFNTDASQMLVIYSLSRMFRYITDFLWIVHHGLNFTDVAISLWNKDKSQSLHSDIG